MRLIKFGNSNVDSPNYWAEKRIEFFIHYWRFIFSGNNFLKFDDLLFKSHRTVLEKIRLQITGNYKKCETKIGVFFLRDYLFNDKKDALFKKFPQKIKESIAKLKEYLLRKNFNNSFSPNYIQPEILHSLIEEIRKWFDKHYPDIVVDCIIEDLLKESEPSVEEIIRIKRLANYFAVEILNHGYSKQHAKSIVRSIFDEKKYPLAPDSESSDKSSFEETTWMNLSLNDKLYGLSYYLKCKPDWNYVFFRIEGIDFKVPPIELWGVTFYNPRLNPQFISSNRTFPEDFCVDKEGPCCNAYIKVRGLEEDQILDTAFQKVRRSLLTLNKELKQNGRINIYKSFITEVDFSKFYGSSSTYHNKQATIFGLNELQQANLKILNKLNSGNSNDERIIETVSAIMQNINDKKQNFSEYWISFETFLGSSAKVEEVFKGVMKHEYKYRFWQAWLLFFRDALKIAPFKVQSGCYLLQEDKVQKFGLNVKTGETVRISKFKRSLYSLRREIPILFVRDIIDDLIKIRDDENRYSEMVNPVITYLLHEINADRNLTLHCGLRDKYLEYKRAHVELLSFSLVRAFIAKYLKTKKLLSVEELIGEFSTVYKGA